jgi:hypothetical protein
LREGLWLATDYASKAAVESIARKRAALTNAAVSAENIPDFTKADRFESLAKITHSKLDEGAWTARMVKHSAIFNAYPEVLASGVEFHFNQDTTYYLDTDGTALRYADDAAWIFARAEGQSADGMVLRDTLATPAFNLSKLPPDDELHASITALARNIKALVNAPGGIVLVRFCLNRSSGTFVGAIAGDNLALPANRFHRIVRLISSQANSTDAPARACCRVDRCGGRSLRRLPIRQAACGLYPFDFEGVKPTPVAVIQRACSRPSPRVALDQNHLPQWTWAFSGGFWPPRPPAIYSSSPRRLRMAEPKPASQMCKERDRPTAC